MLHTQRVWPSPAALATASAPTMPPAPARFSTTTVEPATERWRKAAARRATTSVLPPGGNGTTSRIGRFGQPSCAEARGGCAKARIDTAAHSNLFTVPPSTPAFSGLAGEGITGLV